MWYEDDELNKKSAECDDALESKNIELLIRLSDECKKMAEENDHLMLQAKHYYNSFTCLSNYLYMKNLEGIEQDKIIEKILFLCRRALKKLDEYHQQQEMDDIELGYYKSTYYSTVVNYCNILGQIGRLPMAIFVLRPVAVEQFGMGVGNLALKLTQYGRLDYDSGHRNILFYRASQLLKEAIISKDRNVHHYARDQFKKELIKFLGEDNFEEKIENISKVDFLHKVPESLTFFDMDDDLEEVSYREWITSQCLTLNTLNDIDYSSDVDHDPLHLPNIIVPIKERYPRYHGLFNQMKQEYASARYMIFDGMFNLNTHFSDKDVFLVNTLDYPAYGLNIEKIKSAYRSLYSLFDRIGFFLNDYYDLGIKEKKVSFGRVWGETSKLNDYAEDNYVLKALKWIKKDLYKNSVSDYKDHIDPVLNRTNEIRNIMEHRYLKVLDDSFLMGDEDDRIDELASPVTIKEFHDLAINLLRVCRESMILLVMAIKIEEDKRGKSLDKKMIPTIALDKFDDEWKR